MTATNQTVDLYRGDAHRIDWALTSAGGGPLNLSGATLTWKADGRGQTLTLPVVVDDAPNGIAHVLIDPADLDGMFGTYWHRLESVDGASNPATLASGILNVRSK